MDHNQYMELFYSEAEEILTALNLHLIYLEKNPTDSNSLEEIFRSCHTIKGNAAAMGLQQIEKIAHAMENVLEQIRSKKMVFTQEIASCLFKGLDLLNALIKNKTEIVIDEVPLLEELMNLEKKDSNIKNNKITVIEEIKFESSENTLSALSDLKSVRVNLEYLESVMNIVGQLHISKIQLAELSRQRKDSVLTVAVNEMERTVNQLQEKMMQIRLLPLKYIFNSFPRLVRDDALKESKDVKLIITGGDIGLDRTILDEINDPLLHILRNSVIHGIEPPEERRKIGKPPEGHIHIVAHQEQNMVSVKIQDDGYGLDVQKIRQGLYTQGLMPLGSLDKLSEEEILLLITLPGFSLSERVTERAGRGVGMNVVKNKVEGVGGSLAIQSELGKGTTFTLRLPISMAIIHALLVNIENEIFAIPLYNIIETVKLKTTLIKHVNQQEMVPYRNEVLPLMRLNEKLAFTKQTNTSPTIEKISVVVCEVNHKKIGFLVKEFVGQQEIVIKNLTGYMQNIKGFSGATILGNGRVAMILDLASLIK